MTSQPAKIGFVGLGAMGFGMATHLIKAGHAVTGFDAYPPSLEKFQAAGGVAAASPKDAATENDVYICMVASADQVQTVLFDAETGAIKGNVKI